MNYLIYKHTSPSGKSYIGITNNYDIRSSSHKSGTNGCTAFAAAIRKYGWDNFMHEVIIQDITKEEAIELEPLLIESHGTRSPYGYNLSSGGECWTHSEESKKKMSESRTGRVMSAESKLKKSEALKGRPRPQHVIDAVKAANTGRKWTTEQKAAASKARKGVSKTAPTRILSWIVTSPDGVIYDVLGLKPFCEKHGLVFTLMRKVAAGKAEHHKGWKCQRT